MEQGRPALLERTLNSSKTLALAAALVWLGSLASLDPAIAQTRSSRVDATVSPEATQFRYEFEVFNTTSCSEVCPQIVDWELPIFALTDVVPGTILSPFGWTHEVIPPHATTEYYNNSSGPYGFYRWNYSAANDPLLDPLQGGNPDLYGPNPGVFNNPPFIIHWYTVNLPEISALNPIGAGESLAGFEFLSDFGELSAPYLSSWFQLPPVSGDPPSPDNSFGMPNSPARQAAQAVALVPVPATMALIGIALIGLLPLLPRRKAA